MKSKISFLLAIILAVVWILVFSFLSSSIAVHVIAVMALVLLATSFLVRNKK